MNEKREWHQAQWWDGGFWIAFKSHNQTLDEAQQCIERHPQKKTRIVKHTTEVVEEREPQAERKEQP